MKDDNCSTECPVANECNLPVLCPITQFLLVLSGIYDEIRTMKEKGVSSDSRKIIYNYWFTWMSHFINLEAGNYGKIPVDNIEEIKKYYTEKDPTMDWVEQIKKIGKLCESYAQGIPMEYECIEKLEEKTSQQVFSGNEKRLYDFLIKKKYIPDKFTKSVLEKIVERDLSEKEKILYEFLTSGTMPEKGVMEDMSDVEELIYVLCAQHLGISNYKDPLIEWQRANGF